MPLLPLIFPIFLPYLGCRQRCLFCNQRAQGETFPSPGSVREFVDALLTKLPSKQKDRQRQVAFYGGSFTAIPRDDQLGYLEEIRPFIASGAIDSIRISTRPDALDEGLLPLLNEYGVKTVEIGAQSMIDQVLLLANRGHRAEDTVSATSRLKRWGFEVGLQLMIGLPGDTYDRFWQTLDRVIELRPNFLRIHPTLVLRGSPLETLWRTGGYSPLSLEEAIKWLKRGILKLEGSSIPVARIGLQPTKDLERDLLAGPYHPALHQLVDSAIFYDMAEILLQNFPNDAHPIFLCHPKEISALRGQKNQNILALKNRFKLSEIFIETRQEWSRGSLGLHTRNGESFLHRTSLYF